MFHGFFWVKTREQLLSGRNCSWKKSYSASKLFKVSLKLAVSLQSESLLCLQHSKHLGSALSKQISLKGIKSFPSVSERLDVPAVVTLRPARGRLLTVVFHVWQQEGLKRSWFSFQDKCEVLLPCCNERGSNPLVMYMSWVKYSRYLIQRAQVFLIQRFI